MSKIKVNHGTNDIWRQCGDFNIGPDSNQQFEAEVVTASHLILYNSSVGVADTARTLVLISPDLSNKTIARLIPLLKDRRISCGFSIDDVRFYERVIVVDPNKHFPAGELIRLDNAGIEMTPVPGSVAKIGQELAKVLS